jgi:hypothetical protein
MGGTGGGGNLTAQAAGELDLGHSNGFLLTWSSSDVRRADIYWIRVSTLSAAVVAADLAVLAW